jgi:hypothetical protein
MTGVQYGQRSTLGARDLDLHINIEDQVVNYPKYRKELINRLSGKNFKKPVKSHKYEWGTRDNRKLATTVNVGCEADGTTIVVNDPGVLNVDDVFQDSAGSQYIVESVGGGVNITFRHLTGSTAQTTIVNNEAITVIGMATPQGKNADNMVVTPFVDMYNLTSILEDVVDLTGTQHRSMIRGEENSAQLIARKQMELVEKLQRQLVVGVRMEDKARKLTTLGGIKFMIDTYASDNAIDFGGDIWASDRNVEDAIDDALDVIAEKAFEKPVLYVSPKFMRKFKYIQDDTVKTVLREKARGVGVVKTYLSHTFGEIDVVQLQGMGTLMDDLVIGVDESQIGFKAMQKRGWFTSPLAKLGDSYRWQVLGEYTFKMDVPEAAIYLYNLGL